MNNKKNSYDRTFAQIIDARLKDLGWSRSDLARRLQVTPSRIRALLLQPCMTETVFLKICLVLGMRIRMEEISRPVRPEFQKKPSVGMVVGGEFM